MTSREILSPQNPVIPVSSNIHRLRNATKSGQTTTAGKPLDPDELYRALEDFKVREKGRSHQAFPENDKPPTGPTRGYRHVPQFAASDFMSTATAELPENVTIHPLSLSAMESTILTPERRASVAPDRRASILPDRRASIMPDRRVSVMPDRRISGTADRRPSTVLGSSTLPDRRLSTASFTEGRDRATPTTQQAPARNNFQLTRAQAAAQAAQVDPVRNVNHFRQKGLGTLWSSKKSSGEKMNRRSVGPGPVGHWKPMDFGIESQSPRRHTIFQVDDQNDWSQKDEDVEQRRHSVLDKFLPTARKANRKTSRENDLGKAESIGVGDDKKQSQ
ncbi:MAG: hypothetical protein Q9187_000032, partial [Circinaria calcarea]